MGAVEGVGEGGVMPPRTPVRRAFGLRRGARTRSAGVLLFSGVDGEGGVVDIGVGAGAGGDKTWSEQQVAVRECLALSRLLARALSLARSLARTLFLARSHRRIQYVYRRI